MRTSCRLLLTACLVAAALTGHAASDPKAANYYEDALRRYEKRDMAGTILQLKNALQIDRNMLPVQLLLGKASLATGDVISAEVAFTEAIRLGVNRSEVVVPLALSVVAQGKQQQLFEQPHFSVSGLPTRTRFELLLIRATARSDMGDPRAALQEIVEARALDPSAVEPWLSEVPVRIVARQFREAMQAVDRALSLAPGLADALYQRGAVEHAQGHLPEAVRAYDATIKAQPEHVEALVARAGLLLDLGRVDVAAQDAATLKRVAPTEPRAAYLRALIADRKGDATAARAALSDIVGLLDPVPMAFVRNRPQVLMLGGLAHAGLGNNEKAKPYLEGVQRLQPGSPASKLLARIHLSDKNIDRAIETLEGYLKQHPRDTQAVALLASAHMSQGRPARAAQLMQGALQVQDTPNTRTALGLSLVGASRHADALPEFEAAFRKDPGQVQAGSALVFLYMQARQPAKAQAVIQVMLKSSPDHAGVQNLSGMVKLATGDATGARAAFERSVKADAAFVAPQLNLARMDAGKGDLDGATRRVTAILARDDKNLEAMLEMARLAEGRGQVEDARRWLEKADDHSASHDTQAAIALVDFHLRNRQPAAALDANKRLTAKSADDPRTLMASARALLAGGDVKGAQARLTQANRVAAYDASLQLEIALLQVRANDLNGAAYSVDKALSVQPAHVGAQALMADIDIRRRDFAAAERRAQQLVATQTKRAIGHGLLGDIAAARGEPGKALDHYRRAHQAEPSGDSLLRLFQAQLRMDPNQAVRLAEQWLQGKPADLAVLRALADAHAAGGRYTAARQRYEAFLKLRPDDAETLNNLANVLLASKDPGALKVAEAAYARAPTRPHIVGTLGWAAFQAGQMDRSLQLLRDARLRDPANADTRYFLASVLAKTGRSAEARDELESALRDKRAFAHVQDAESLLKTLR